MVATEATGKGINLQFCSMMVNYDIPWNPNRLEQRMGRVHRYGQDREVFIWNLIAKDTREGQILERLFENQNAKRRVDNILASHERVEPAKSIPGAKTVANPVGRSGERSIRTAPARPIARSACANSGSEAFARPTLYSYRSVLTGSSRAARADW